MSWFKKKAPQEPVKCFHEFRLERVYTHYWDNGCDTSSELKMVLKCIHCFATNTVDEYDYKQALKYGLINAEEVEANE